MAMQRKVILRSKVVAIFWLLAVSGISGWLVVGALGDNAINTNLMSLLPKAERDPVVFDAVERIGKRFERHFVLLVGAQDFVVAKAAAQKVVETLEASKQFDNIRIDQYQDLAKRALSFYLPLRFQLIGSEARAQLLKGDTEAFERGVLQRYYNPKGMVSSYIIDKDPFLLIPRFLEQRSVQLAGRPEIRDGYLTVKESDRIYIVLIGDLSGSPFSVSVQRRLMPLLKTLRSSIPVQFEGSDLLMAGVLPHAAAGTDSAISEMSTVGLGSLLGIVFMLFVIFRSPRPFILTLISIALGCLAGLAACLAVYGEVNLVTLVFGASLVGISVDYSLHYFCERFRFGETWSPNSALRHIFPGITLGLVTSVIGFLGLFFAPFPGMHGMALFSCVGLVVAYGSVVICYPHFTQNLKKPVFDAPLRWMRAYSELWQRRWGRRGVAVVCVLFVFMIVQCFKLVASDDVRLLQTPDADVMAEEMRTRALIGRNLASQFFLVEGRDESDFLAREERLTQALRALQEREKLVGYMAISDFIASPGRQLENRSLLASLISGKESVLGNLARQIGLPKAAREGFAAEFFDAADVPPVSLQQWLAHPVSKPHRHLWLGQSARGVVGVVGLRGVYDLAALQSLGDDDPQWHFLDPAGGISDLFGQYRHQTIWLTAISYAVVLLLLIARYGVGGGLMVMAPPVIAALASLSVLAMLGESISLFNVMALLLVLGIGVDYALFFRETGADNPATLFAIGLSSLTTLLAFGLLSLSATTAIHAFGLTILVGILVAFFLSPMAGWCRPKTQRV